MPKVALTYDQKIQANLERLTRETKHLLSDNKITYTALAETLGISPQAVQQQFSRNRMTLEVWLGAQMLLKEKGYEK